MKITIVCTILGVLLFFSCNSDYPLIPDSAPDSVELDMRSKKKIAVCHYSEDDDEWVSMMLPMPALARHVAHGDILDMDDDGYYGGECGCGPIDCDDDDPNLTDYCFPEGCMPGVYEQEFPLTQCVLLSEELRKLSHTVVNDYLDCTGELVITAYVQFYGYSVTDCGYENVDVYAAMSLTWKESDGRVTNNQSRIVVVNGSEVELFHNSQLDSREDAYSCLEFIESYAAEHGIGTPRYETDCGDL